MLGTTSYVGGPPRKNNVKQQIKSVPHRTGGARHYFLYAFAVQPLHYYSVFAQHLRRTEPVQRLALQRASDQHSIVPACRVGRHLGASRQQSYAWQ